MSWSAASVAVFAGNVLAKLALDAVGVAAGGTTAALTSSILLSLGLTLLGEAAVVWFRSQSLTAAGPGSWAGPRTSVGPGTTVGSGSGQYRGTVRKSGRPTIWPPIR
jgi:hypothetical protein